MPTAFSLSGMVRAIYERNYKSAVFVEVVPTDELVPHNPNDYYDSLLFSKASGGDRAPVRRRVDEVDELTWYLESDVLNQATDVLQWWKVSCSNLFHSNLFRSAF